MPIGVFDSGLGGLSILAALQKKLPDQAFIYFGDNANAPYGPKNTDEIYELTTAACTKLFDLGCDLVIIACNTSAATALHKLQTEWLPKGKRRVLGVFVPMIENLTRRNWGDNAPPTHTGLANVALFATAATVASGAFPRELKFRARDVLVEGQACPGLVDAIEARDDAAAKALVERFAGSLLERLPAPQAAVLGCTHYPLVRDMFAAALPATTRLIDQPEIVADSLADYLARYPHFAEAGTTRYLTSGDAAEVSTGATRFLGRDAQFSAH
ncbi:MAG: aspartate/glutamate racemase family protein [Paracoccaceae bacterium]